MIRSTYATRATIAVRKPRPVMGSSRKNAAMLGIVYITPVTWVTGPISRRRR